MNLKEFHINGWQIIRSENLEEFAHKLGRPIGARLNSKIIDELKPQTNSEARKDSVSSIIGKGFMPFHTDCAYYKIPPRFLLLQNDIINSDCATLIINLKNIHFSLIEMDFIKNGLWFCSGQKSKFLTPIFNNILFRWDEFCMKPMNKMAKEAKNIIIQIVKQSEIIKHYWTNENEILLIDNWNVLHAREKSESERILKRILVEKINVGI